MLLELAERVVERQRRVDRVERRLGDLTDARGLRVATRRDDLLDERLARDHPGKLPVMADEHGANRGIGQPLPRLLGARGDVERAGLRNHRVANVLRAHG